MAGFSSAQGTRAPSVALAPRPAVRAAGPASGTARRWRAAVAGLALVAALAAAGVAWRERTAPLRALGAALVHEVAAAPADVAVVSMAQPRGAALDAAKLHRRGVVREVWLPRWRDEPADRRVDALGQRAPRPHEEARDILRRAGVPASAIVVLDAPVTGLEGEMAAVGRVLRTQPGRRSIVVTARSHTARARLLLRAAFAPKAHVQVRAPQTDRFDPGAWWRTRDGVREVVTESLKWVALLLRGPETR